MSSEAYIQLVTLLLFFIFFQRPSKEIIDGAFSVSTSFFLDTMSTRSSSLCMFKTGGVVHNYDFDCISSSKWYLSGGTAYMYVDGVCLENVCKCSFELHKFH